MRALYINAITKKVEAVTIKEGCVLASLYGLLACRMVDALTLHTWPSGERETLWIDDESLLGAPTVGFSIAGDRILAGSGVILLCDREGDSASTRVPIAAVRDMVTFLEFDDNNPAPQPFIGFVGG